MRIMTIVRLILDVACDVNFGRLRRLVEGVDRLRLADTVHALAADGRRPPLRPVFDVVLVDAPCSGLGVLRRRAEARWRASADAVSDLARRQRDLLRAAAGLVRPGGRLVYSVCTWTAAETLDVANWASAELVDFSPQPPSAPWRARGVGGQLLPSDGVDGMYVLNLLRR